MKLKKSSEAENHLDATLAALADPTRRAILSRLADGEARVSEIAAPFAISLNAVSKHLKILERAGLARRRVTGREHLFSFNGTGLAAAAGWIEAHRRLWTERLGTLEGFLRRYGDGD